MNIKTANRLCELRKSNNLSQEELANKLGVSRQAVSKWERSEASPDTDNLIELARLYNISLDELVNGDDAVELIEENKEANVEVLENAEEPFVYEKRDMKVSILGDEIIVKEEGKEKRKYSRKEYEERNNQYRRIRDAVFSITTVLVVVAYLTIGFTVPRGWANYWFLFILIPVPESIVECVYNKNVTSFNVPCLVASVYCALGMILTLWHPMWALFFIIPVFYIIADIIDGLSNSEDIEAIEKALDKLEDFEENKEDIEEELSK